MAVKQQVIADLQAGELTQEQIAANRKVSLRWVNTQNRKLREKAGGKRADGNRSVTKALNVEAAQFEYPIRHEDLTPAAARGLEDIEYFAARYFGIQLLPWQVIAAEKIVSMLESPLEEYAVINVAPGSGKTVFFGRVIPTWLTVRNRAMRGMIGSATNTVSTKIVDLLRRDLTRPQADRLTERDVKQGLIQAESTLPNDYGRFRPDTDGALWTRQSFEVAQFEDSLTSEKEPTWTAFGKDTTFIGWRVDFALWDDLWDPRKVRSGDAREDFFEWFDSVAETRLEPGGLFLLQGQRLDPNDIYRYALDKRTESGSPICS